MISRIQVLNRLKSFLPPLEPKKPLSTSEKVDRGLVTTSIAGTFSGIIASTVKGLTRVGLASPKVTAWATPLIFVAIVLHSAGIALKAKSLFETHMFSKTFAKSAAVKEKVENYTIQHFSSAVALINGRSECERHFVKMHFDIDSEKLKSSLKKINAQAEKIFNSNDSHAKENCQRRMKRTVELLDERLLTIKKSKALVLTVALVSIVGTIVLMTTPAAPVGLALIGAGIALEVGHYFKIRSLKEKFERDMTEVTWCNHLNTQAAL